MEPPPQACIEAEQEVYRYEPADNGASPLWCMGSTCLVRIGKELFASGLETVPSAKPLHNVRWLLFRCGANGWELVRKDEQGRTREPCPLLGFPKGPLFLSANPTLTPPDTHDGPAQPQLLQFAAAEPGATPKSLLPTWSEAVEFNEHSYRNLAADGGSLSGLGDRGAYARGRTSRGLFGRPRFPHLSLGQNTDDPQP